MGLPQQVSEGQPGVLPPRVDQVLFDKFAEPQTFVQLAHHNQTAVGSDSRSLKCDPQKPVE